MQFWEIVLLGVALSMDAVAVGMTNGMVEPKMKLKKLLFVAFFYGAFQFLMPVVGYFLGDVFSAFVERIAPWLSFALLFFIGGKMVYDCFRKTEEEEHTVLGLGKLCIQALATSIDALAVGVTLLAAETGAGLPCNIFLCALTIGCITFVLSSGAVFLGKKVGDKFSDKAELLGGAILIAIGLKILIEGLI